MAQWDIRIARDEPQSSMIAESGSGHPVDTFRTATTPRRSSRALPRIVPRFGDNADMSHIVTLAASGKRFEVREDDFLYVLQEEPADDLRAKCEEAARVCPKQAITIVDIS